MSPSEKRLSLLLVACVDGCKIRVEKSTQHWFLLVFLQFTRNLLTIIFVQALLGGLNNPVTQNEACNALASLLEVLKPVIDQYLPLVITPLCVLLQTGTPTLKPIVVDAIGSAAHVSNEKFLPYFPSVMAWFRYFLLHFSHDHELRTAVMTSVGRLARAVGGDTFRPYLPEISKGAFEGIKTGNENVSKGCFAFLEIATQMYGKEFVAQQPDLVNTMLAKSRIQTDDSQAPSASKEAAIDAIGSLAVAAPTSFSPFVEQSTSQLVASLSDPSDSTRIASANALFKIIKSSYELRNGQQWKPGINTVSETLKYFALICMPVTGTSEPRP